MAKAKIPYNDPEGVYLYETKYDERWCQRHLCMDRDCRIQVHPCLREPTIYTEQKLLDLDLIEACTLHEIWRLPQKGWPRYVAWGSLDGNSRLYNPNRVESFWLAWDEAFRNRVQNMPPDHSNGLWMHRIHVCVRDVLRAAFDTPTLRSTPVLELSAFASAATYHNIRVRQPHLNWPMVPAMPLGIAPAVSRHTKRMIPYLKGMERGTTTRRDTLP